MSKIKQRCINFLQKNNIDLDSEIDFDVNGEIHTLSFRYIIDTFMLTSKESQNVFFSALEKSTHSREGMGIEKFFEGMGQLLLMTHLSQKINN